MGLRPPPAAIIEQLLANYSDPDRFYHTVKHLEECFLYLHRTRHLATYPAEVELALWFHDAIYDTHGKDSEERSASWVANVLWESGAAPETVIEFEISCLRPSTMRNPLALMLVCSSI